MVEVAVMVDPASTQAGQVTFSTHRREEAGGQNCGQGFFGFTSGLSMDKNGTLSLN